MCSCSIYFKKTKTCCLCALIRASCLFLNIESIRQEARQNRGETVHWNSRGYCRELMTFPVALQLYFLFFFLVHIFSSIVTLLIRSVSCSSHLYYILPHFSSQTELEVKVKRLIFFFLFFFYNTTLFSIFY